MCAPVAREKIVFTTQKYHKLYTLGKLNNINNKSNNDKKGEVFQKSYMSSYNKYYIFSKTNAVWIKKTHCILDSLIFLAETNTQDFKGQSIKLL